MDNDTRDRTLKEIFEGNLIHSWAGTTTENFGTGDCYKCKHCSVTSCRHPLILAIAKQELSIAIGMHIIRASQICKSEQHET